MSLVTLTFVLTMYAGLLAVCAAYTVAFILNSRENRRLLKEASFNREASFRLIKPRKATRRQKVIRAVESFNKITRISDTAYLPKSTPVLYC